MTTEHAQRKAQEMVTAVNAGQTLFIKTAGAWTIVGPIDDIKVGYPVLVTKADGTTSEVVVTKILKSKRGEACQWASAEFRNARRVAPRTGYTEVVSSAYGTGRRYHAQPGATVYNQGKTQIWDNS